MPFLLSFAKGSEDSFNTFKEVLIALIGGNTSFEIEHVAYDLEGNSFRCNMQIIVIPDSSETWSNILVSVVKVAE